MKPIVHFIALVPNIQSPTRADPTLGGTVPLRAYRFCEPFTQASGFGWTLFAPIDFRIFWDGAAFHWKPERASAWSLLRVAQMPGYSEWFRKNAPERYRHLEVPFMTALPESGMLQVWSGFAARTRRNWSLLVRGPINAHRSPTFFHLEGIVEHDWWFGPVMSNLQFMKTDCEVRFTRGTPLFAVQPIPRMCYSTRVLQQVEATLSLESITDSEWASMEQTIRFEEGGKEAGAYARIARKRPPHL